jgi:methylmalonyl-CoA/ethylmalonyl-CoA epimerase
MTCKLDHVGIVVKDIAGAVRLYNDILGATPWSKGIIELKSDGLLQTQVRVGDNFLEFFEPTGTRGGAESHPARCLREKGEGLFHLTFFVDDFDKRIADLKKKGFTPEETEVAGEILPGAKVKIAFLHPEETRGVWIEFVDASAMPEYYQSL